MASTGWARTRVLLIVSAWYAALFLALWGWVAASMFSSTDGEDWGGVAAFLIAVWSTLALVAGFAAAIVIATLRTTRSGWTAPAGPARAILSGTRYAAAGLPILLLAVAAEIGLA